MNTKMAARPGGYGELPDQRELAGQRGHDADEDQQRHPVADAPLGYQLAQPHHERRACGHGDHHQHDAGGRVVLDQHHPAGEAAAPAEQVGDARRLEEGEHDGDYAGPLGDDRPTRLALVLELLQLRDDHRQELHDDAGGYVWEDAEAEHREVLEGVAREEVEQTEGAALPLTGQGIEAVQFDPRHRDRRPQPVEGEDAQGEEDLASQIRNLEHVAVHVQHQRSPPRLLP